MEASSHGLDQGRTDGLHFNSAVFTNLSHEHLDYHKTLEAYLKAKLKLFGGLDDNACAIINKDSEYFDELIMRIDSDMLTYGIDKDPDVSGEAIKMGLDGSRFILSTPQGRIKLTTPLIGRHNIYNILAASAVAVREGIAPLVIKKGIEALTTVPGRMEAIRCGQNFNVFVDYAHTEDALRNVLGALRAIGRKNKILLVFGCGGDRDTEKRPKMGMIARELADYTIITSDNPRSEDPREIASEVEKGFKGAKDRYEVVLDRYEAIKKAIKNADKNTTVLLAGKGHEKKQILKNKSIPFDDREVARTILEGLQ